MSHNLKKVAVILLSLSDEEKEMLSNELKEQNYKFDEDPIGTIVRAIASMGYKQAKERMEKEKTEQTAFEITFEEFSKRSEENNGFDIRYPADPLSTKTSNKELVKKMNTVSSTNNQSESKD